MFSSLKVFWGYVLIVYKLMIERHCSNCILEGKVMAVRYESKYTETSATLNNGVDELLVGTLRQIRLKFREAQMSKRKGGSLSRSPSGNAHVSLISWASFWCRSKVRGKVYQLPKSSTDQFMASVRLYTSSLNVV